MTDRMTAAWRHGFDGFMGRIGWLHESSGAFVSDDGTGLSGADLAKAKRTALRNARREMKILAEEIASGKRNVVGFGTYTFYRDEK